jgi:hypothetical protein
VNTASWLTHVRFKMLITEGRARAAFPSAPPSSAPSSFSSAPSPASRCGAPPPPPPPPPTAALSIARFDIGSARSRSMPATHASVMAAPKPKNTYTGALPPPLPAAAPVTTIWPTEASTPERPCPIIKPWLYAGGRRDVTPISDDCSSTCETPSTTASKMGTVEESGARRGISTSTAVHSRKPNTTRTCAGTRLP